MTEKISDNLDPIFQIQFKLPYVDDPAKLVSFWMMHTNSGGGQDGDEGLAMCTMSELLEVADTGRPWVGSFSNEIGQIKVYTSRTIDEEIVINH